MSSAPTLQSPSRFVSPVALKIAAPVGVIAGIAALFASCLPLWAPAPIGLGIAAIAYGTVHVLLVRRLGPLRSTLMQIRKGNFADLAPPTDSDGDEITLLLRDAYRTGQSVEKEIQELKEMESYRREFIGNVSHELKTPIFSIQGFAETLLNGALEDEDVNRSFLEKIVHNANRLDNLARDLSTITKIETDELDMSSQEFDVADLFESTVESVELKANESGISFEQHVPPDLPIVYGDRERLRRVLVNLADNAIKYNEHGGYVRLRAEATDGEVKISVEDNGIGIPPDHLPRLTERFYRVDKSRSRNQGGTGLGLAIVKHILAAHDRELHVESMPGKGSTFSFTLPTAPISALKTPSPAR